MKQVLLNGKGEIEVWEVPIPSKQSGSILVQNAFSLISSGTEGSAVSRHGGWVGFAEKVWQKKEKAARVWNIAKTGGIRHTSRVIQSRIQETSAIGYSSAGLVVECDGCSYDVGQPIACMGSGFASHAEYVAVPEKLTCSIPKNVPLEEAAFASLGCIAMQGIRRCELTPGETVVIIGLGLVGQLAIQLAQAMGYRAIGLDLRAERCKLAEELGAYAAWSSTTHESLERVLNMTKNVGTDGVVVCAATSSEEPMNLALDLCRQRGRVSVIGDVGMKLDRSKMYRKELEVRLSCAYGPGRYDEAYELKGVDYPIAFARWTEGRNLEYFLDLLQRKQLNLTPLIQKRVMVDQVPEGYAAIKNGNAIGVLIDYGLSTPIKSVSVAQKRIDYRPTSRPSKRIALGLIGCGNYVKSVHLPNLKQLDALFRIEGVATRSGASAAVVAKKVNARLATSDYRELLADPAIDAVLIGTRHASHGKLAAEALEAGKHVFVEKPMAITLEACERIVELEQKTERIVRVGFNRRFAPLYREAKKALQSASPKMLFYRVNIGQISKDWSNTLEEGGRLLGEGCHFFDLFNWMLDQEPVSIVALTTGDARVDNPNVSFCARYPDGSTATLIYTSLGSTKLGKECFEAFGGGRSIRCEDFNRLDVYGGNSHRKGKHDKGQRAELEEFAAMVRGESYPVLGADGRAGRLATWMALAAYQSAMQGEVINLESWERSGGVKYRGSS